MTFTFLQRIWKIYSQLQHKNSPSSIQNGSQLQLLVADWLLTESSCSTTIIFAEVTISFQWRHIDTTSNSSNSNKYNACSQWNIDLHRICFTDSKTNFIQCIHSNNRPLHWFPRGDHHHAICFIFAAHYFTFLHFLK